MSFAVLLPFFAVFLMFFGMSYFVFKLKRWKALPVAPENLECSACGSHSISEQGLWGKDSLERVYICQDCSTHLFKNQLPDHDDQ